MIFSSRPVISCGEGRVSSSIAIVKTVEAENEFSHSRRTRKEPSFIEVALQKGAGLTALMFVKVVPGAQFMLLPVLVPFSAVES